MDPVRIGHVGYFNAWPLVEGLGKLAGASLVPAAPAELVGLLTNRAVDVALVSTADLVRTPQPLAVLGSGMIGSHGPILTVKLFSDEPIESIKTVHADTESHTSVALCRLLVAERSGTAPTVEPFRADGTDWPASVLMIGDKVITRPPPDDRYKYVYDLGEAWSSLAELPMVYAVWACLASRADEPWVPSACAILDRQRRHNATRLPMVAARHAADHGWPADLAQAYCTQHVRYDLDDAASAGLDEFLARCAQAGVLPEGHPVRWHNDGTSRSSAALDH